MSVELVNYHLIFKMYKNNIILYKLFSVMSDPVLFVTLHNIFLKQGIELQNEDTFLKSHYSSVFKMEYKVIKIQLKYKLL